MGKGGSPAGTWQPFSCFSGSLGARLHELKQKVVAENPQHFGVAIPRKSVRVCVFVWMCMHAHVCAHEGFLGP